MENTRIHLLKIQNDKNNLQEDMLENYKRFSQQLHNSLIVVQTLLYKIIHNSCIDILRDEKCKDPELKNKVLLNRKNIRKKAALKLENAVTEKEKIKYLPKKKEVGTYDDYVIEDNENFIVINKPTGIPVQSGTKSFKNIIDILKNTKYFENSKPFIVHRLDKETSGIILFAKNRKYAQLFTSLFRLRKIHKTYLAICNNQFNSNEKNLKDNLIYYEKNRQIIQKAETTVNVLDSNTKYSLLELNPITGRKHQLRKQLAVRDCPIVGDNKYNVKYKNSNFKHLMLHAYSLKFKINERKYSYYISPDENFLNLLKKYNFKLNKFF